jgi:spore coat protein U-like protein
MPPPHTLKLGRTAALCALLSASAPASALCTLLCACSASTTAVAFGAYNPLATAHLDISGAVRVRCGGVLGLFVPYEIELGKGSYGASHASRLMANGSQRLQYNLYTDSARMTVWGDGSGGSQTLSDSVTIVLLGGTSNDHPVYGRIPRGQTSLPPGAYSDTVTVTVTYW